MFPAWTRSRPRKTPPWTSVDNKDRDDAIYDVAVDVSGDDWPPTVTMKTVEEAVATAETDEFLESAPDDDTEAQVGDTAPRPHASLRSSGDVAPSPLRHAHPWTPPPRPLHVPTPLPPRPPTTARRWGLPVRCKVSRGGVAGRDASLRCNHSLKDSCQCNDTIY